MKVKAAVNNSRAQGGKAKAQEECSEENRNVKRNIKADNRNYMAALATEVAYQGNLLDIYPTIKNLSEKFSKPERSVKDKEERKISDDIDGWSILGNC